MTEAVEILKSKYKLPVGSVVQSIQEVCTWELSNAQWLDITKELGATPPESFDDEKLPKYSTRYLIQNLLKHFNNGSVIDIATTYQKSVDNAKHFIKENPWVFAVPEDAEPKLNPDGSPAPKKGDKKVLAKQVYEDNKDKGLKRKQWIELLVKEVGLTDAGASTYYANLKSGKY